MTVTFDVRTVSCLLGAIACGMLLWRLLSTWCETPALVHALAGLLTAFLVVGSIGQALLAARDVAPTGATYAVLVLQGCAILLALFWRWLQTAYFEVVMRRNLQRLARLRDRGRSRIRT